MRVVNERSVVWDVLVSRRVLEWVRVVREKEEEEEEDFKRRLVDSVLELKISLAADSAEESMLLMGFPSDSRNLPTFVLQQSSPSKPCLS